MAPQKHGTDDELSVAEEESDDSSVEEDSEAESEKEVLKSTPNPIPQSDSEGEDDETDEEGNEDSAEEGSQRSAVASNFIVKTNNLRKHAEKNSNPAPKRSLEARKAKESRTKKKVKIEDKNVKKDEVSSVSAAGPGVAPRVWSKENELALLQGVIDYQNKTGYGPHGNMNAFTVFVKGNLFPGVVKSEIYEKLRRLKGKILKYQGKGKDGSDAVLSNPHEFKTFELSKKEWGGGTSNKLEHKTKVKSNNVDDNGKVKSNLLSNKAKASREKDTTKKDDKASMEKESMKKDGKGSMKKETTKKDDKGDSFVDGLADGVDMKLANGNQRVDGSSNFLSNYSNLQASVDVQMSFFKENLHLIGDIKVKELEERWANLQIEEVELASKRLSLIQEQTKLVLDAVKKG